MKAEKIAQTAEAFNENVSTSMKWFQESATLMFETQSKQMKFATDMYVNLLNSYFGSFDTKNLTNSTFGSQKMTEMIAINIEHISKMAEENLKVLNDFSNQANTAFFVKDSMEKLMEYYRKQTEMITAFNQTAMSAFTKETEISNVFMKPFTENLRNEFALTSQLFTEGFKDMVAAFNNMTNPSFDSNRKFVSDAATQMQSAFQNSIGLWADFMNKYSPSNFQEESANGSTKKESVKDHTTTKSKLHAAHV